MAGKRGPAPTPAKLHLVRGNPSKKDFRGLIQSAEGAPVELPSAPEHLDDVARAEWDRAGAELLKLGLVAAVDRAALAAYCASYARWVYAETRIKQLGDAGLIQAVESGYQQIGVWLQISNRALDQMHRYMAEFGMSPSARTRVTPSPQQDLFGGQQAAPSPYFKN